MCVSLKTAGSMYFSLVLLGSKVPKASARRSPRECTPLGAARGAQDQALAPPRDGRAACRTLFFRVERECGFVVPSAAFLYSAALYLKCSPTLISSYYPHGDPRLGSDGERASGRLKATAAGTVCLQTRAVARRRFQPSGRRQRNRSGGFCCFSPPKSREKEKVFSCTFGAKSTKSLRTSFSAGACDPRRCPGRARSSLCATPWRTRRSPHPLFPRQTRVRIGGAAAGGKGYDKDKYVSATCALFFTPHGDSRLGSDGGKADGGLKARAAGTVCLQTRAVARRRFQTSGRRHRNRSGGFCCFSPPKSREKSFLALF